MTVTELAVILVQGSPPAGWAAEGALALLAAGALVSAVADAAVMTGHAVQRARGRHRRETR